MPHYEPQPRDDYPPICDYAVIGDCRTAAIVAKDGSIEWLCLPQFDSPSIFGAMLDRERGGRFRIHLAGAGRVSRRYIGLSNVLETTFESDKGQLRLIDQMSLADRSALRRELWPDHELLRVVTCERGEVEVEVLIEPRPAYGRASPHIENRPPQGCMIWAGRQTFVLRSETSFECSRQEQALRSRFTLRAGERRSFSLAYSRELPPILMPLGDAASQRVEHTQRWWQNWADHCTYDGPHRQEVVRSALALKLLTFSPSGAVVAAPTTSLPEHIGGVRNWDYRYCWLRDASMTFRSLTDIGFEDEAEAFLSWLIHATWLSQPQLKIMYDVWGETRLPEHTLDHWCGYRHSQPVRIGNAASDQLQLDVYGTVADTVLQHVKRGGTLSRSAKSMMLGLGRVACKAWREPDNGIWELRHGCRHHTFSKVMCWVTLDRLAQLHELGVLNAPVDTFTREMNDIRTAVLKHGFNEHLNSFVDEFDSELADASLLLLAEYGFEPVDSPRMLGTLRRIELELGAARNDLLYRYSDAKNDSFPGGEGTFGVCAFWRVQCLANTGEIDKAEQAFDHLLSLANDVGLFAEEIDGETGALLGNFPQAYTHVGLINAALAIQNARAGTAPHPVHARPTEEVRI